MFKVQLIVQPAIDLGQFRKLIHNVNELDILREPPHAKFARAVDELLDEDQFEDMGEKHLFYGFYFEMPYMTMLDLQNYEAFAYLRLSTVTAGMMVRGIITAPLDMWRDVIRWCEGRNAVQGFAKAIEVLLPCR